MDDYKTHSTDPNIEQNTNPQIIPLPSDRSRPEIIIQPSTSFIQEQSAQATGTSSPINVDTVSPSQSMASSVYPEAIKTTEYDIRTPSQQFALSTMELQSKDTNRPVSLRVKSLLVLSVISLLGGIYNLMFVSLPAMNDTNSGIFGLLGALFNIIAICMSLYLLIGRDHNTAALILKIFLGFQVLGFVSVLLLYPIAAIINGVILFYMFYVYMRVSSLRY